MEWLESQVIKYMKKKIIKKFPKLSPKFIFLYPSYNLRNNEISATFGLSQLGNLKKNNILRNNNFKFFIKKIDSRYYVNDFDLKGCSNYAFPLILKKKSFSIEIN